MKQLIRPKTFPFFYGWVVVAATTMGMLASIPGQTLGVSVFTDYLISSLSLTRAQLALAYLFGTVASSMILPFVGTLFDTYGSRIIMTVSCVVLGVVLLVLSQCDRIAVAIAGLCGGSQSIIFPFVTIAVGFLLIRFWGQGMITMSSRIMLGKWFNRKRGLASGINNVAVSFFFALAPLPMDWLVQRFTWRGAWIIMGITVGVLVSVAGWIFFRDNPEECGLTMDGDPEKNVNSDDGALHNTRQFTRREAMGTPAFWIYNLVFSMHGLLMTAITFHIVSIGAGMGLTRPESLRFFLPMSVVGVTATIIGGPLMDRYRLQPFFFGHIITLILGTVGVMALSEWWGQALMVGGLGIAGGIWGNLMMVMFPRFYGREHLGSISSVNMSFMVAGSALGPYLFGFTYDYLGSYRPGIIVSLVPLVMLGTVAFLAKNPQKLSTQRRRDAENGKREERG